MKLGNILYKVSFIVLHLTQCSKSYRTVDHKAAPSSEVRNLSSSVNEFGVSLYREISKTSTSENVFLSPFSITSALAMTYLGARNETARQMAATMKLKKSVHVAFEELLQSLNSTDDKFTLQTANRAYVNQDYQILKKFQGQVQKHYHSEFVSADFGANAEKTRKEINHWVESKTANKIKDFLGQGSLTPVTALFLVNAIYFKGKWLNQFNMSQTVNTDFHVSNSEVIQVKMMNQKRKFPFKVDDDLGCKVLELPYNSKKISMLILLPNDVDGLKSLEAKLTPARLTSALTGLFSTEVNVSLPIFTLENEYKLKDVLVSLGMTDLFLPGKSDLSGIDGSKLLYVSDFVHKAFVDVNEEGTEAAAATGLTISFRVVMTTRSFVADHPFLFVIRENESGMLLFIGRMLRTIV